jgi:hypothetical protein
MSTPQTPPLNEIFGRPREGIHAHRMPGDLATADVAATLLGAYYIGRAFKISYWEAAAYTFAAGILAHRAFGVRTTVDKFLFPDS